MVSQCVSRESARERSMRRTHYIHFDFHRPRISCATWSLIMWETLGESNKFHRRCVLGQPLPT